MLRVTPLRKILADLPIFTLLFAPTVWRADPLLAVDVKGDARLGLYSRTVEFQGDLLQQTAGETNNDEQVINAQLKLDLENLDDSKDRFLFDFRDKRDNFGKLERENFRLTSYDRRQLRVAAFQRPWESNRLYFTLGRFSLPEANILANDGAELGYRGSKTGRYGLFAGQGAKDLIRPLYVDPDTRAIPSTQAGAYYTIEKKEEDESSYHSHALAQAPSYEITDAQNHAYYYQQGLWTFDRRHRISTLVHFDFSPKSNLRRGYASYYYQTEKLRVGGYVQQTNSEDYLLKQTMQDNLAPSSVRTLNADLRYFLNKNIAFDLGLNQGTRAQDGLARQEVILGVALHRILGDSSSTRAQYGTRKNFQSEDKIIRLA